MEIKKFKNLNIPDSPGVYFWKAGKEVLYIGKATSLRSRVRSYFSPDLINTRGLPITDMVFRATNLTWQKTSSVLEALILESNLIKKFQPKYNVLGKDNKTYNHIAITDEEFPVVILVRGKELEEMREKEARGEPVFPKYRKVFGPYPYGSELRKALEIMRKIFSWRDEKCVPCKIQKENGALSCTPCFPRQVGLCPGVCTGEVDKKEYSKILKNVFLFLEGKTRRVINDLKKQMHEHAKKMEFERAGIIKRRIFALEHINDVALIKRESADQKFNLAPNSPALNSSAFNSSGIDSLSYANREIKIEAFDVAHISGEGLVGAMVVLEGGVFDKKSYKRFRIRHGLGNNEIASLKEILGRRLNHKDWPLPDLFVLDGGKAQINTCRTLMKKYGIYVPVVSVVKDERHKPKGILGDVKEFGNMEVEILKINAEAHRFALAYHRKIR